MPRQREKAAIRAELIDSYFDLIDMLQADVFVKGFKLGASILRESMEEI